MYVLVLCVVCSAVTVGAWTSCRSCVFAPWCPRVARCLPWYCSSCPCPPPAPPQAPPPHLLPLGRRLEGRVRRRLSWRRPRRRRETCRPLPLPCPPTTCSTSYTHTSTSLPHRAAMRTTAPPPCRPSTSPATMTLMRPGIGRTHSQTTDISPTHHGDTPPQREGPTRGGGRELKKKKPVDKQQEGMGIVYGTTINRRIIAHSWHRQAAYKR